MPIWRLQCAIAADTTFPRDALQINPHFNDSGIGSDPQNLCDDMAAALDAYVYGTRQIIVKAYDAQGTAPVYPQGETVLNQGLSPNSGAPREIAICLSYFSERNIPRRRGRLYLPYVVLGFGGEPGVRCSTAHRAKVGALAQVLADIGGADVDWSVFSRTNNAATPVTNWWVDDEWDTIRSRGLIGVDRTAGTVGEA